MIPCCLLISVHTDTFNTEPHGMNSCNLIISSKCSAPLFSVLSGVLWDSRAVSFRGPNVTVDLYMKKITTCKTTVVVYCLSKTYKTWIKLPSLVTTKTTYSVNTDAVFQSSFKTASKVCLLFAPKEVFRDEMTIRTTFGLFRHFFYITLVLLTNRTRLCLAAFSLFLYNKPPSHSIDFNQTKDVRSEHTFRENARKPRKMHHDHRNCD